MCHLPLVEHFIIFILMIFSSFYCISKFAADESGEEDNHSTTRCKLHVSFHFRNLSKERNGKYIIWVVVFEE